MKLITWVFFLCACIIAMTAEEPKKLTLSENAELRGLMLYNKALALQSAMNQAQQQARAAEEAFRVAGNEYNAWNAEAAKGKAADGSQLPDGTLLIPHAETNHIEIKLPEKAPEKPAEKPGQTPTAPVKN